jgi:hypothetical protein
MESKLPAFTFRTLINNYGHFIKLKFGMDESAIEKDYNEYKVLQPGASVRDYMWSLFQRIVLKGGGSDTYFAMGVFVSRYEGKNGNQYHRIALKAEFEGLREQAKYSNIREGIAVKSDKRCPHSMKFDGVHDFDDFPDGLPLASDECSLDSCTCCFSGVPKRDENGSLVFTDKVQTKIDSVKPPASLWSKLKFLLNSMF